MDPLFSILIVYRGEKMPLQAALPGAGHAFSPPPIQLYAFIAVNSCDASHFCDVIHVTSDR
jgi:hypothetical protein